MRIRCDPTSPDAAYRALGRTRQALCWWSFSGQHTPHIYHKDISHCPLFAGSSQGLPSFAPQQAPQRLHRASYSRCFLFWLSLYSNLSIQRLDYFARHNAVGYRVRTFIDYRNIYIPSQYLLYQRCNSLPICFEMPSFPLFSILYA